MAERDTDLDIFRGLVLMYIVGVIHNLYWMNQVTTPVKSLLLIEMPVIFFITGASNSFGRITSLADFYRKRLKRILYPYAVYALICAALSIGVRLFLARQSGDFSGVTPPALLTVLLNWLNPFGAHSTAIPFIAYHLWFIPTYLVVIVLFPFLKKSYDRLQGSFKPAPLAAIALLVAAMDRHPLFPWSDTLRPAVFYCFWTYLGLFYKRHRVPGGVILLASSLSLAAAAALVAAGVYGFDMQVNKFPPNLVFLLYTAGCFGLLAAASRGIVKLGSAPVIAPVVRLYSRYSLTMYLYHSFSWLLVSSVIKVFGLPAGGHAALFTPCQFVVVLLLGLAYPAVFGRFEVPPAPSRRAAPLPAGQTS